MRRIVSSAALSALLLFLLFSLSFAQVEQTVTALELRMRLSAVLKPATH
jgi:hypothetical protein